MKKLGHKQEQVLIIVLHKGSIPRWRAGPQGVSLEKRGLLVRMVDQWFEGYALTPAGEELARACKVKEELCGSKQSGLEWYWERSEG
jgi:hypothetical protein